MASARLLTLCAAAAGALLSTAYSAPAAAATHVVVVDKMKFGAVPPLKVGDTIVFVNRDMFRHTVTAQNGRFNLDLASGKRGNIRVNSAGQVAFYCKYHPGMRGTMVAR